MVSGNTGESVREQENKWTDLALHQFNESNTAGSNNWFSINTYYFQAVGMAYVQQEMADNSL